MTNDTWIRYGAGTGVGAVVLYVIGALIMPRPPAFDAPTSEVVAYFADDQSGFSSRSPSTRPRRCSSCGSWAP